MAERKGMNTDQVRALSGSLETQLGIIDHVQTSLATALVISNNPVAYALSPGSLVVAPWSIFQISSANADLGLAKASARELVTKLLQEAAAQGFASSAEDGSYQTGYAWRTPDARRVPELSPWDLLPNLYNMGRFAASQIGTIAGTVEYTLELLVKYGGPAMREFSDWWQKLPPWASSLKKVGRALPWLGTAVSAVDLAAELMQPEPDPWQITRHSVSIGLDVASEVATGTIVGAPAGLVLAGVGIVWDVAWDTGERMVEFVEHGPEMVAYYEQEPWMAAVHILAPVTMDWWGPIAG